MSLPGCLADAHRACYSAGVVAALVVVVLVLGAPRARTAGPAFALGWIGGLLAVSVIVVLVLGAGGDPDSDDPGISWLKVALGILFLVMAANQAAPTPGTTAGRPAG